ncbi:hypothetical protein DV515_00000484 [Chloebia gouldiae]|uniref:Uncharacterized protein n=1 Tax=Chloebia gouldiae TaxID=44316 RepID=A0A3L8T167_CHLGU|nr:hypothetical protein DV515_00000484 [Chloebia gouldiae]
MRLWSADIYNHGIAAGKVDCKCAEAISQDRTVAPAPRPSVWSPALSSFWVMHIQISSQNVFCVFRASSKTIALARLLPMLPVDQLNHKDNRASPRHIEHFP